MPNTIIYYFSATGNSLVIARTIAERLGDSKLVPMTHMDSFPPTPDTTRIGLVFPVYIFGLPLIVTRFIEKLKAPANTYLFAVAASGGMPCSTLMQAARLFSRRGMTLAAGFAVTMVDNYTPIAGAIAPEKQKIRFEKAARKIIDIGASIEKGERSIHRGTPLVNWLFSGIMYRRSAPNMHGFDKKFFADAACNGCGVCEKVCPVKNITMHESKPQWQHQCEQCFACLHWCPQCAIQYGKKTAGRARYHHPDVAIHDIMDQAVSDACRRQAN